MGPAALRVAGLLETLQALDREVDDFGDLPLPAAIHALSGNPLAAQMRQLPLVAAWCRAISHHAFSVMREPALPIFLGGDHSISMGTVNGVARHAAEAGKPLVVLWLDAHADFNTPASTPSGNMHGMSVASLAGEPGLDAIFGDEPRMQVPLDQFHLFGARSIDKTERRSLRERGVDVIDMRLIDEFGVAVLLRRIIDRAAAMGALLHVSLDIDFLDPSLAPGVGTTVPGGATYREAHLIMEMLHDSGLVASLDIVELNPFLDVRGQSALLLVDLVASLFGRRIMER
jgi:arginase